MTVSAGAARQPLQHARLEGMVTVGSVQLRRLRPRAVVVLQMCRCWLAQALSKLANTAASRSCRMAVSVAPDPFSRSSRPFQRPSVSLLAPAVLVRLPEGRRGINGFVQQGSDQHFKFARGQTQAHQAHRQLGGQARLGLTGRVTFARWLARCGRRPAGSPKPRGEY
jgi:hypothetical protein